MAKYVVCLRVRVRVRVSVRVCVRECACLYKLVNAILSAFVRASQVVFDNNLL